ncbi:FADD [Mytilus coruscus]|uniref:FADD n=1 Tax=Mytilus coruscus TaxID=42192 RepID=A0A6J8C0G8_MYTCO|nr:FADD [Mytilus coruscus]
MLIMSGTNGTIIPQLPSEEFPLNVFLQALSKKLSEEEFEELKFLCQGKGGIRKGDMSQIKNTLDLFTILRERLIITNENLLTLQAMIWHIGRKDLYKEFVCFCEQLDNTLYFFEAPEKSEDEQEHVKFHVIGYTCMTDLYKLRGAVSKILCCPEKYVIIRGIEQCNSLWITLMILDWCTDILMCLSIKSWKVLEALTVDRIFIQSVRKEIVCPFNIPENVAETEHEKDTDMTLDVNIDLNSATISVSDLNNQNINKREGGIYSYEDEPQEKLFEEIRKFWSNREDQNATATVHPTATTDKLKFEQRNQTFRGRKASLDTSVTTSESKKSVQNSMHETSEVQSSAQTETESYFAITPIEDKDNKNGINKMTDMNSKKKAKREGVNYSHGDSTSPRRTDSGFQDLDEDESKET